MSVDQGGRLAARATPKSPGTQRLDAQRDRYDRATANLDPPLAIVDLGAFDRNAADMTRRAAGHPIRVATKSLRCRYLIERALARPGYRGVMCYSLPEALWLHAMGTSDDLLVAYPTVDRQALRALAADEVTELTAGSGLVGPTLFDAYRRFKPEPALIFALPVVRRPSPGIATLFSGGYVASGTGTPDRLPRPYLPAGLSLIGTEGAGEVQTPVRGAAAAQLRPGDRVWLRHAKAGELAERLLAYHVIQEDGQVTHVGEVGTVPTYRGEGQCFG